MAADENGDNAGTYHRARSQRNDLRHTLAARFREKKTRCDSRGIYLGNWYFSENLYGNQEPIQPAWFRSSAGTKTADLRLQSNDLQKWNDPNGSANGAWCTALVYLLRPATARTHPVLTPTLAPPRTPAAVADVVIPFSEA
ncbi:MAG: hypothetical protein IPL86_19275 [Flavobacteriales bacterium]|nr:hypothetical protein [Flavobacteriales bacterium]